MSPYDHPTYFAFIGRIRENPDDDGVRLICADWLEEQGEVMMAALLRGLCKGGLFRCDDDNFKPETPWYFTCYGGYPDAHSGPDYADGEHYKLIEGDEMVAADAIRLGLFGTTQQLPFAPLRLPNGTVVGIVNGLAVYLKMPTADWVKHAAEILKRNPIRKVTLTAVSAAIIYDGWDRLFRIAGDTTGFSFDEVSIAATNPRDAGEYMFSKRWPGIEFTFERQGIYSRDESLDLSAGDGDPVRSFTDAYGNQWVNTSVR